MKHFLAANFSH